MVDLQEQIEEDEDIVEGQYFFDIYKCNPLVSPAKERRLALEAQSKSVEQGDERK